MFYSQNFKSHNLWANIYILFIENSNTDRLFSPIHSYLFMHPWITIW